MFEVSNSRFLEPCYYSTSCIGSDFCLATDLTSKTTLEENRSDLGRILGVEFRICLSSTFKLFFQIMGVSDDETHVNQLEIPFNTFNVRYQRTTRNTVKPLKRA